MRKKRKKKAVSTSIGIIIKKRLIELGMKQKELAAELGIFPEYLCMIVSGARSGDKYLPEIERILKINLNSYKKSA